MWVKCLWVSVGCFILPEFVADAGELSAGGGGHNSNGPAIWSVLPFVALLLMIATGPLFYAHFWHKNYPIIAVFLGALVIGYYVIGLDDIHHPVHSMAEYVSFISLLTVFIIII